MKDFKEYLVESSLGRFYQHFSGYKDNTPRAIGIVTASRKNLSVAENKRRNAELRRLIKQYTYEQTENQEKIGFVKVIGTYAETQENGQAVRVKEESTVLIAPPELSKKLRKLLVFLGQKYDQDSVFFAENGQGQLIFTRTVKGENGETIYEKGHVTPLGAFHPQQLGMAFTKIKGKTFAFDWIAESVDWGNPSGGNEAQIMESATKAFNARTDIE